MADSLSTSRPSQSLTARRLRLASGLVLFTFVTTHLLNHTLGLVSLEAAELGRRVFLAFWRSVPMTVLFYGAFLLHLGLALAALHDRRTLRMPPLEATRLMIGLAIPALLAVHFTGTRMAHELYGIEDGYTRVAGAIWGGGNAPRQLALVTLAWVHGCLGIHFVLRHRAAWQRALPAVLSVAVLLPVLAALGLAAMGREVDRRPQAPAASISVPTAAEAADAAETLPAITQGLLWAFYGLLAAALLARSGRNLAERWGGRSLLLQYPGRRISVPRDWSVLEASRAHGIAHLSLCGGRGRCSTCRIRVAGASAHVPPPALAERRTLARIRAPADVRLACQLRPLGDLAVTPLLPARQQPAIDDAAEREVVVLFVDLRGWSTLSEQHLPHDLAYVLDQFFETVAVAVRASGGVPNQFIGDSVMALFGLENDLASACGQALAAAAAVDQAMQRLRARLRQDFGHALDHGMGLHAGQAAIGEVGWRDTRTFSAVGDAVNVAARLQELCKAYGVRLVVSAEVLRVAGREGQAGLQPHDIAVRGREDRLRVYAVDSPERLAGEEPSTRRSPAPP